MKKPEVSFDSLPDSAVSETVLNICLKCAFDFFTRQLKLAPRTAFSELKKHVPGEADFTGAATARPHFFPDEEQTHCPYCNGAKRWFARFKATRVDAHPLFEKERKKLWTALRKDPERFTLWHPDRTQMQIFSEWLERLQRSQDLDGNAWLLAVAVDYIGRAVPSKELDQVLAQKVKRVQLSRQLKEAWRFDNSWLYVGPELYGDVLLIQHLLSRSHLHGGRSFEGRLTLHELIVRLRRIGYFEARGIETRDQYEAFEQAVASIVASGPPAVYYAVDRSEYLKQLKATYEKKRGK
jgi:hypothetical protein